MLVNFFKTTSLMSCVWSQHLNPVGLAPKPVLWRDKSSGDPEENYDWFLQGLWRSWAELYSWVSFKGIPSTRTSRCKGYRESAERVLSWLWSWVGKGGEWQNPWNLKCWQRLGPGCKGVWVLCSESLNFPNNASVNTWCLEVTGKKNSREIKASNRVGMTCRGRVFDTYLGFHIQLLLERGSMWSLQLGLGLSELRSWYLPTSYPAPIFTLKLNSIILIKSEKKWGPFNFILKDRVKNHPWVLGVKSEK